jgi:hypothetical protein
MTKPLNNGDHPDANTSKQSEVQRLRRLPYFLYLQTAHWRHLRRCKLREAGERCQICNAAGNLDVHHRTYERRGEELLSDLTVLCRPCHSRHHGRPAPLPNHRRVLGLDRIRKEWPAVQRDLEGAGYLSIANLIREAQIVDFRNDVLLLRFHSQTAAIVFDLIGHRPPLAESIERVTGIPCTVQTEGATP